MDESNISTNVSDRCFICKVFFDRNLKRSRRRILRDRDDLVAPFVYLLHAANKMGIWFALNDMTHTFGPINHAATTVLQQMFACRKCFEKVIKLEKELRDFEVQVSQMLDQSCDTLLSMNIINGEEETIRKLQTEMRAKEPIRKVRKIPKKKAKVTQKKKKKIHVPDVCVPQQQQTVQKTKQILVLAKAQEGDQQQLLLLQVPANDIDSEGNDSQSIATLDHQYHHDENHAVFLSSNAIPVTTCVTVTSEDHQVLEVQIQQDDDNERDVNNQQMKEEEELNEENDEDNDEDYPNVTYSTATDETSRAVNAISSAGQSWNLSTDGVIVVNDAAFNKRKADSIDEDDENDDEEAAVKELEDYEFPKTNGEKPTKAKKSKRTYSPRSSSPLPASGESKIVVHLMYGSKQWKRTMEGDLKSIIRDMALGRFEPAGRKIAASDKLCTPVMKCYAKRLISECKDASRTIRVSDHQDVTQLDMRCFTSEIFLKCPKTANFIKSLIPVDPRDTLDEHGASAVIMGIILYMHSMQSNTLQHILSYALRKAGCNREGFKTLHSLGLTLSYTSILKVLNDIDAKPDYGEKSSLDTIERSIENVVYKTKAEEKGSKKRGVNASQETSDPLFLQFSLPYYPSTDSTGVTYASYQATNQTEYTTTEQYDPNNSNVYNS